MGRFTIQNVRDQEINRVLRQIQDYLNTLADGTVITEILQKINDDTPGRTGTAQGASLRMVIPANMWVSVVYPGSYTVAPNYRIECRSTSDVNRILDYQLQNVTRVGYQIKVTESARMQLDLQPVTNETTY